MRAALEAPTTRALAVAIVLLATIAAAGSAAATTATIDPSGNLLVDGEPFFPIGIYHVTVQIRTSDGPTCWEAVFPASGVAQSNSTRFKAQSDS